MKKAGFIFIVIVLLCSLLTAQSVQSFAAEAKLSLIHI